MNKNILIKAYQSEFENSDISIPELCKKYNIASTQLGDTKNWKKPAPTKQTQPIVIVEDKPFLEEIQEVKKLVIISTREFFENYDPSMVSTKEFKDMSGVLKDLEAGEFVRQGKLNNGPTVNILVQNLTKRFKDDC